MCCELGIEMNAIIWRCGDEKKKIGVSSENVSIQPTSSTFLVNFSKLLRHA